jgi:hypothetical protein
VPAFPFQTQPASEPGVSRLRPSTSPPIGNRLENRLDQRQSPVFELEGSVAISSVMRSAHFLLFRVHVNVCRVALR